MNLTSDEREAGLAVIRRWPEAEVRDAAKLPPREQALLVLAAGLLDLAPGRPVTNDPIEIRLGVS